MENYKKLNELKDYLFDIQKSKKVASIKRKLTPKEGENYADVVYFSDQHIGSEHCDFDLVKYQVDKCVDEEIPVFLGGDLIEGATKTSIGAGVYQQDLSPNEQYFALLKLLTPLAEKDLIIAGIHGNHEERFIVGAGLNIINIICSQLEVPYLGKGGFINYRVGNQSYNTYSHHGYGGAREFHMRVGAVMRSSKEISNIDLFTWGHLHELAEWEKLRREPDSKGNIINRIVKYVMTGHYLKYDGSYADDAAYAPTPLGSPTVRFYKNQHKIDVIL